MRGANPPRSKVPAQPRHSASHSRRHCQSTLGRARSPVSPEPKASREAGAMRGARLLIRLLQTTVAVVPSTATLNPAVTSTPLTKTFTSSAVVPAATADIHSMQMVGRAHHAHRRICALFSSADAPTVHVTLSFCQLRLLHRQK